MQSLAALATLMIVLLWTPLSVAEADALQAAQANAAPLEATQVAPAREPAVTNSAVAESTQGGDWLAETLQTLSPIPVLALGLLGLFWIRRHTAEL